MAFNTFDEITPIELMKTELEDLIQQYTTFGGESWYTTINGNQTKVQENEVHRINNEIVDENPVADETIQTVTKIETVN
ncbi:985_t:CDS:2, partial [Gigaspora rosea]